MNYLSVKEMALRWNTSERSVRNYCAAGRVKGAFLTGKTWCIPADAEKPRRKNQSKPAPRTLLTVLTEEQQGQVHGGIYHKIQIELTYNSNHLEGSRLTHDQTRFIFETNTVGISDETIRVDDILETAAHFRCIDEVISNAKAPLSEKLLKRLHFILKSGTSDAKKDWFAVGDYKKLPNEVGGRTTTLPEEVQKELKKLLNEYNAKARVTLQDVIRFHVQFERIHPFQDGNGRIGRLIMLKECLKHDIVPFIIEDRIKAFYYRGLAEWDREPGYLTDTCLAAQDTFKQYLQYFRIPYSD